MFCDGGDTTATGNTIGDDVEFLSDAGAEHADQMIGVSTDQGRTVGGEFVGDPAAAGHGTLDT
jgi:hypothetical protein